MSQSPALGSSTSNRSWLQNSGSSSPAGNMLPDYPTIGRIQDNVRSSKMCLQIRNKVGMENGSNQYMWTMARAFSLCLRRRAGISQMATVARAVLHSADIVRKLHRDWKQLDVTAVAHECCTLVDDDVSEQHRQQCRIRKCLHEFEKLLYQHSTVDRYLAWVHSLVHSCVFQVAQDKKLVLPSVGRQFLLTWTFVLKVILKDLTLVSADMFGSYHLLGMTFTDYIMFLIEQKEHSRMTDHLACVIYRGLAPDWVEEGKDEEASVIGGNYFVRDPVHPIASDCAPSVQLYNAVCKSEGRMSACDTAGGQLGFSHLSLGEWSALADHRCRNDTNVSHGDVDGAGITFDVTIPTSLTRSSSIDSRNATSCVDEYQGCGAPGSRVEDSRHHVSTDPLITYPCLVAPPLSGGSRPRQVVLPYSTSESLSACLDHVTDTLSSTDCGWYQPASSNSRHYSSSDGWCTRTAADYSLKPSDFNRVHDTTTSQWCGGSSVSHDAAHSCYDNSAWYYSGGEQAGSTKLESTKKIQHVRCVDMPVTNGNAVCVGGTDTVAVDNHGGRAFVGEQLESPSYRMQEHAGSRCYQWRQPCTTTSGASV